LRIAKYLKYISETDLEDIKKDTSLKDTSFKKIVIAFLTVILVLTILVIFTVQILPNTHILTIEDEIEQDIGK
jgi:hypothetical protein